MGRWLNNPLQWFGACYAAHCTLLRFWHAQCAVPTCNAGATGGPGGGGGGGGRAGGGCKQRAVTGCSVDASRPLCSTSCALLKTCKHVTCSHEPCLHSVSACPAAARRWLGQWCRGHQRAELAHCAWRITSLLHRGAMQHRNIGLCNKKRISVPAGSPTCGAAAAAPGCGGRGTLPPAAPRIVAAPASDGGPLGRRFRVIFTARHAQQLPPAVNRGAGEAPPSSSSLLTTRPVTWQDADRHRLQRAPGAHCRSRAAAQEPERRPPPAAAAGAGEIKRPGGPPKPLERWPGVGASEQGFERRPPPAPPLAGDPRPAAVRGEGGAAEHQHRGLPGRCGGAGEGPAGEGRWWLAQPQWLL